MVPCVVKWFICKPLGFGQVVKEGGELGYD